MVARFCGAVLAVWIGCAGGVAAQDTPPLAQAVNAAGARDWDRVREVRAELSDAVARDVIDWMRLRGRQGSFQECTDFLERNGDWPGLPLLRLRCEYSIPKVGASADTVLDFFSTTIPQTGTGSLRLIEALKAKGRQDEAKQEARRAWQVFNLAQAEHDAFVDRHGDVLKDLHTVRLDMLLWRGEETAARRMFNLVPEAWAKLAVARLGLRENENGVDGMIEAVPEALAEDAGLAFERFIWRARKGRTDDAVDVLLERSLSVRDLGQPIEWANRRRSLARELMRDGKHVEAYAVASQHFLTAGSDYADLEWLSGFLALRKLRSPEQALVHFNRFQEAVETPISLGRAGYWLGRAHEAKGENEAAKAAYEFGAKYQSSFYGQLAAERAGVPRDPLMTGTEEFPDWRGAEFTKSSVYDAAVTLHLAGLLSLSERFLVHLAESQSREGIGQMIDMALEWDEPHIALMLAKEAARQGHEIYHGYFPLAVPNGIKMEVPEEFALSIARRESEFDPVVVSGAGARGLMQLMPGTAEQVAGEIGEDYQRSRLTADPDYNARLGTAYLRKLSERFGANPVLMSIGYNAGPSRAERWPSLFGDPRGADVDVVDWIESIPFRETRNYVMRVTESFAPYRARLNGRVDDIRLSDQLKQ
ncbi:lytic transglycosylase domain-containing protein [Litoreibacter arenae]|uniref:Soluble lytic murein transglycosylase n=1 Tax=Litoreibacter arenae DSM 19593 TaxID=1123360 RepID=S9RTK0_9RHOB|nr:lytic transglycosylase domain-containing protein [Litoreibacter arenae]EPX77284.1 Soluble lytic murein transglycosylase precursor [Litoreibacter arenae DSM 19593]